MAGRRPIAQKGGRSRNLGPYQIKKISNVNTKPEETIRYRCCCANNIECNDLHRRLAENFNITAVYKRLPSKPPPKSTSFERKQRVLFHLNNGNQNVVDVQSEFRCSTLHFHRLLRRMLEIKTDGGMPYFVSKNAGGLIGLGVEDMVDFADRTNEHYYYFVPTLSVDDIDHEFYPETSVVAADIDPTELAHKRIREKEITRVLQSSDSALAYNEEKNKLLSELRACCQQKDTRIAALQSAHKRNMAFAENEIISLMKDNSEVTDTLALAELQLSHDSREGITRNNIRSTVYHKTHTGLSRVLFGALRDDFDQIVIFYKCMFGSEVEELSSVALSKFEQFLIFCMYCNGFSRGFLAEVYGISAAHIGVVINAIAPYVGAASKNGYILEHEYREKGEAAELKYFRKRTGQTVTFGCDGVVFTAETIVPFLN